MTSIPAVVERSMRNRYYHLSGSMQKDNQYTGCCRNVYEKSLLSSFCKHAEGWPASHLLKKSLVRILSIRNGRLKMSASKICCNGLRLRHFNVFSLLLSYFTVPLCGVYIGPLSSGKINTAGTERAKIAARGVISVWLWFPAHVYD